MEYTVDLRPAALTLDTGKSRRSTDRCISDAIASSTSMESFESALEVQKRRSQEAAAEVESLKRSLSMFRQKEVASDEVVRERDDLQQSLVHARNQLSELRTTIKGSEEKRQELENNIESLKFRLEAANNVRIDILEGFNDAWERLRQFHDRDRIMKQDMDRLREQVRSTSNKAPRAKIATTEEQISSLRDRLSFAPDQAGFAPFLMGLQEQLQKSREESEAKDQQIEKLEREFVDLRVSTKGKTSEEEGTKFQAASPLKEILPLDEEISREYVLKLRTERDELSTLLRAELRRQARLASHAEAGHIIATVCSTDPGGLRPPIPTEFTTGNDYQASLEGEISALTQEIVLYKLDIRGYKKDLRKAAAHIRALEDAVVVPSKDNEPDVPLLLHSTLRDRASSNGLGITLDDAPNSSLKVKSIWKEDLDLVQSNSANFSRSATPSARNTKDWTNPNEGLIIIPSQRTPPATYKRLPRLPRSHANSSPIIPQSPRNLAVPSSRPLLSPVAANQPEHKKPVRNETMRSLSESIISSYTHMHEETSPTVMVAERVTTTGPNRDRHSRTGRLIMRDIRDPGRSRGKSVGAL